MSVYAAYRTGRAGDPPELRQHRPHLRRHGVLPASGAAAGLRHLGPRREAGGAGLLASGDGAGLRRAGRSVPAAPGAAADLWLATTKAPQDYTQARFSPDCWLFFGKETAGLPEAFRAAHYDRCLRLPMRAEARSLNLSNSVAILTYEALRQNGFPGLTGEGEMAER